MTLPFRFEYDADLPLDTKVVGDENRDGVVLKHLSYTSPIEGPGEARIDATLVTPPDDVPPPHPAVLWIHWFEPDSPTSNRTQFVDEAVTLAREGVISLLPDAFWTMEPARWTGPSGFLWRTVFEHDRDLSLKQTVDLRRSLDVLLAQPGIDKEKVAFVGHDFGAMYGALMAGVEDRVGSYVLLAGTYSFSDWFVFGSKLSKEEEKAYIEAMRVLDPTHYIAQAAPAALFFQFAHHDYYVPERAAQVFYDAASDPKKIAWYDASHDMEDTKSHSRRDRLDWLRERLGSAG